MEPRLRVAVCLTAADRLLLVGQGKAGHRYWLLPGGGVERGETLVEAAHRELIEETGIDVAIGRLLIVCEAIEPGGRHLVNLVFSGRARAAEPGDPGAPAAAPGRLPEPVPADAAIEEVRWVSRDELLGLELRPPIAEAVAAAWSAGFGGAVQVLGNVWSADPGSRGGPADPPGR
ncbi:MAG: NUDIX domain-containing protein [Candidatus Dormibacteria bacterium]